MLVLSRKIDERIFITLGAQTVEVRVLRVEGNKVRLGIEAPEDVAIHREEIWQQRETWAAGTESAKPRQTQPQAVTTHRAGR